MAYKKHARWTIYGAYDSPPTEFADEIWNFGFHTAASVLNDTGGWPDATPADLAAVVGPKVKALIQGSTSMLPTKCKFVGLKVAFIGEDGKYAQDAGIYESPAVSGGPNTQFIPQGTVAVSLVSDKFRPPARYGRMYLPGFPLLTAGNMAIDATNRGKYITFVDSLLDAAYAGDEVDGLSIPCLVSPQGHVRKIVELWCGSIVDTQRRRRNRGTESYTKTAYNPT